MVFYTTDKTLIDFSGNATYIYILRARQQKPDIFVKKRNFKREYV